MTSTFLEQYKNYLRVMRLPAGASADEIEARFKFLAHRHHPDHNDGTPEATEKFRLLLDARNFLKNNFRAGQVWARTKDGLEWEWNRPSYRETSRRQEAQAKQAPPPPPPRPLHVRKEQNRAWEGIRPVTEAKQAPKATLKKAKPASTIHAKAHAAYRAVAGLQIDKGFTAAFLCVLLAIYAIYWKTQPKSARTVGDFGKKIESVVTPPKPKAKSTAPSNPKLQALARKTIAQNWGLVANCLGAMPTKRYYKGSITYRVQIERQLASKVVIVKDTLGFPLAHKCVSRAIFAMDFAKVSEKTTVEFSGMFELGAPRVAGR